jgi:hypothetical protein
VSIGTLQRRASEAEPASTLVVGIGVFAVYHLGLGLFMAIAPHAFFTAVGPFGARNDHYVRDVATYNLAFGAGFAAALRLPSWRLPVLAIATIQFALHSANHLADIGAAHPAWIGYFDFASLAAATALLAWLWRGAAREEAQRASPAALTGAPR